MTRPGGACDDGAQADEIALRSARAVGGSACGALLLGGGCGDFGGTVGGLWCARSEEVVDGHRVVARRRVALGRLEVGRR